VILPTMIATNTSAAMIHSASAYCGNVLADERMAAVFFWMGA